MTRWLENIYEMEVLSEKINSLTGSARRLIEVFDTANDCELIKRIRPAIEYCQNEIPKVVEDYDGKLRIFMTDMF